MRRSVRRMLLVLAAAAAGTLVVAAPASAHITVDPEEAVPGSMTRVVFRMPNEGDSPSTRLEVHFLPEGAPPIPSALTTPVPGWTVEVTYEDLAEPVAGAHGEQVTEAVSVITWTAEAESSGIQPGQFGEFPVEIGPLPQAEELYFPTLQTYAGVAEPVRWISPPDPDGGEPPDPAPLLRLTREGAADGGATSPTPGGTAGEESDGEGTESGSTAGVWLGLAGLLAGLAGLALGGTALMRTRR